MEGGSVLTDSDGNGIRSRVRFGARRNQGVGSRTCLRTVRGIRVAVVIPVEASLEKRRVADSVLRRYSAFCQFSKLQR